MPFAPVGPPCPTIFPAPLQARTASKAETIVNSVVLHCLQPSPERKVWCEVRSESWWEGIAKRQFSDDDWVKNFRMSRDAFEDLCREVGPFLQKQDTRFRNAISIDNRVSVSLWRLSANC